MNISNLPVKQDCNANAGPVSGQACDIPVTAVHNVFWRKPLWRLGEQVLGICQATFRPLKMPVRGYDAATNPPVP
jgi:hypothetical protein